MTGYLLDSQILLWFRDPDIRQLPSDIIRILEDPLEAVYYSVVTPWELSIKYMKGKLKVPKNFFSTLPKLGFDCLPVAESHVLALHKLPKLHGDPFDRMLAAQALHEKMTIITADRRLTAYPVKTLLAGK